MAKNDFDELMSVGIDIGKDTFHIVAFDPDGLLVMRKQIKRLALVQTNGTITPPESDGPFGQLEPCRYWTTARA